MKEKVSRLRARAIEFRNAQRSNNSNAADGQESLVLSSKLLAAADLSRWAALARVRWVLRVICP
jgi:hypothetical protein